MALKYIVKTYNADNKESSSEAFNNDASGLQAMYESARDKYNSGLHSSVSIGQEDVSE
jgi:hypothetical protein